MNAPVRRGQIWADTTPGNQGRTIRIERTDTRYAYATLVTPADDQSNAVGRPLRIPHSGHKGLREYRLVSDPRASDDEGSQP
jgi:hypothetical protein